MYIYFTAVEGQMPPCLAKFDKKFRACMTEKKIIAENFFKLLSNTSDGTGMTMQQLNNTTCRLAKQNIGIVCLEISRGFPSGRENI